MLCMTKRAAIDFEDLRFLEISCANCKTRTTIDVKDPQVRPPTACSGCSLSFDKMNVQGPVSSFIDVYRMLSHEKQAVKFRVVVDEPAD